MGGEELIPGETQELAPPTGQEQKILVLVRLRPLNEKELAKNDVSDWECVNNNTIIYKNNAAAGYTFDRVFGKDCPTNRVYEGGAKEVILSVLSGINSSIFAYGQTSSGKTYTMHGITEKAAEDIYDYVDRHQEREFVLKFSAIEIYNESVRDLLSSDTSPLRLLDDPEKGTVVERLTEETLTDLSHLKELLAVCEAQRLIGETSLNETSSRSHQILRLTIESSPRKYLGAGNSSTLSASVNFVDLAGSERASQTLSAGARLKEGCHINRSLLTLGTVIRKLSKEKNAHIPYRDSKLTRILQNSLGGNARTAIICTMSPARSHVEQSRNTLLFASCAKEVSNNAQVNVVMSDKALVKQLQRELARLETEMKNIESTSLISDSARLLREKEQIIEQMHREIRELTEQRDLARSRVENLLQSVGEDRASGSDEYSEVESSDISHPLPVDVGVGTYNTHKNVDIPIVSNSYPQYFRLSENVPKFVVADVCQGWEENAQKIDEESEDPCKEVRCIEMEEASTNRKTESDVSLLDPEEKEGELSMSGALDEAEESSPYKVVQYIPTEESPEEEKLSITEAISEVALPSSWKEDEGSDPIDNDQTHALKQKIQELQKTINYLGNLYTLEQSPSSSEDVSISRGFQFNRSTSCKARLVSMPSFPALEKSEHGRLSKFYSGRPANFYWKDSQTPVSATSLESQSVKEDDAEDNSSTYEQNENTRLEKAENTPTAASGNNCLGSPAQELSESKYGGQIGKLQRRNSGTSISCASDEPQSIRESDTEDSGIHKFASGQHGVNKYQCQRKYGDYLGKATESESEESTAKAKDDGLDSDQDVSQPLFSWPAEFGKQRKEIVELWGACNVPLVHRTYFFLLFKGDPSDSVYMEVELRRLSFLKGGNTTTENFNSSLRSICRERDMFSKQIHQKFPRKEREELYKKWGIALNTKQRSLQLARRLWSNTKDMNHVNDSAALVAELVGFSQPHQAPKEIFGLTFSPGSSRQRSYSWRPSRSPFRL